MPYLHWETDRHRARFESFMRDITRKHEAKVAAKLKANPITPRHHGETRDSINSISSNGLTTVPHLTSEAGTRRRQTGAEAAHIKVSEEIKKGRLSSGRFTQRSSTTLGRVLQYAALLWEAMDCHQDERMIESYLHNNPPLHPRRTLAQSYDWDVKSSEDRDKNQVVYRMTAPKRGFGWDHGKIARVIMVDQLWLWILDGSTAL